MDEISKLAQKAKEEWRLVLQVFQVNPEQFQNQTEAFSALQAHKEAAAKAVPPPFPPQAAGNPQSPVNPPSPPAAEETAGKTDDAAAEAQKEVKTAGEKEEKKEAPEEKSTSPFLSALWSYVKIILVAFLIAFVLRAYVFDLTMVDGTSMDPTLKDEDKLITAKVNYYFSEPRRGDIVVLNAPDMPGHDYIKRVIGLPNERITIQNGKVYINSEQLIEPYLNDLPTYGDIDMVIPDGYYFVMGDNRTDSRDSREDKIGVISKDAINGKAVFRLLPFERIGGIY